jgi:hypothetical protein
MIVYKISEVNSHSILIEISPHEIRTLDVADTLL